RPSFDSDEGSPPHKEETTMRTWLRVALGFSLGLPLALLTLAPVGAQTPQTTPPLGRTPDPGESAHGDRPSSELRPDRVHAVRAGHQDQEREDSLAPPPPAAARPLRSTP